MPFFFGPVLAILTTLLFGWPALLVGKLIDPKLSTGCRGDVILLVVSGLITALVIGLIVLLISIAV